MNRLELTRAVNYLELTMVESVTENCSKCGKQIFLKNVLTYKVLPSFRLICAECATKEGLIQTIKQRRTAAGAGKKLPRG